MTYYARRKKSWSRHWLAEQCLKLVNKKRNVYILRKPRRLRNFLSDQFRWLILLYQLEQEFEKKILVWSFLLCNLVQTTLRCCFVHQKRKLLRTQVDLKPEWKTSSGANDSSPYTQLVYIYIYWTENRISCRKMFFFLPQRNATLSESLGDIPQREISLWSNPVINMPLSII